MAEDTLTIVLDVGNSGVKLGAVKGTDVSAPRRLPRGDGRAVREYATPLLGTAKDGRFVVYGSDPGKVKDLVWEIEKLRLGTVVTLDPDHPGIPQARVAKPEKAGVDRRVQALGAARLALGRAVVVSCGTALTVDLAGEDGALEGGAILPGLTLGMRALAAATAQLPVVNLEGSVELPGRDTETAIRAGVVLGATGAVERILAGFDAPGAVVYLTGNDAALLSSRLERSHRIHPGLGLYGAAVAARQG